MTDIVVYGIEMSTYVWTTRLVLEEKGLSYTLEKVDWRSDAYRSLHPFNKMPAFRYGGVQLFETAAITAYLEEVFPDPPLQPADAAGRARMNQWIGAFGEYFYADIIRGVVLEYAFPASPDGKPNREKIDAALPNVERDLAIAESLLSDKPWLIGKLMTRADLFLAPMIHYLMIVPESPALMKGKDHLRRWFDTIRERPSFKTTIPASSKS